MQVYIGSDHGGVEQKEVVKKYLEDTGYSVTDCGSYDAQAKDDYPDFAVAVGRAVSEHPENKGILLCRSGEGMIMAANKIPRVRAALAWRPDIAKETRADNDANVLVLPSDFISDRDATEIVKDFLETPFSQEDRHVRRLEKMDNIEKGRYES